MSVHKLTAGDGYAYLTRHVAAGDTGLASGQSLTAYYEQTGNPAGRWHGAGLEALGYEAAGRVVPGDRVREASMPAVFRDGVDRSPPRRSDGPTTTTPHRPRAVVGYDLTFTAPKSVSVLWGLADSRTRATCTPRTRPRWPTRWRSSSTPSSARGSVRVAAGKSPPGA